MSRFDSWHTRAIKQLSVMAHQMPFITSDDLHDRVGEPPRHHNQMGAAINEAVQLGVLVPTGLYVQTRRPSGKGRTIKLFRSGFLPYEHHADPVAAYFKQARQESLFA